MQCQNWLVANPFLLVLQAFAESVEFCSTNADKQVEHPFFQTSPRRTRVSRRLISRDRGKETTV